MFCEIGFGRRTRREQIGRPQLTIDDVVQRARGLAGLPQVEDVRSVLRAARLVGGLDRARVRELDEARS